MVSRNRKIEKNIIDAQKLFNEQLLDARKFITLERRLGFFPERFPSEISQTPDENALKTMNQDSFAIWLRQQIHFQQAKKKIVAWSLSIMPSTSDTIISCYREQFALERICALLIHFFTDKKNKLTEAVVTKKKKKPIITAMKKLQYEMNKSGGVFFEESVKQHLFQALLENLLESEGHHPYNAKRIHISVLRQIFTTQLIRELDNIFEKISSAQIVELCLDITSIFFAQSMDKRDLEEFAKLNLKIKNEEKIFLEKTVKQILIECGSGLF